MDKENILKQLKKIVDDNLNNLWDDENFKQYYLHEMNKELEKVEESLDKFFEAIKYFTDFYSKDVQYSLVLPRKDGKYSLFCYTCRRWIPNTANYEMAKEGYYSHYHFCKRENGIVTVYSEEGVPEEEGILYRKKEGKLWEA